MCFRWIGAAALLSLGACGGGDDDAMVEPTYENVEATLMQSCGISSSCHAGPSRGQADFNVETAIASDTLLDVLTVPACEYSRMPRIDPGHPESSWLMIKLTAAHGSSGDIEFTPAADWAPDPGPHPATSCPLIRSGDVYFGTLMPQVAPFAGLPERQIEMFRQWIAMGAPGPAM